MNRYLEGEGGIITEVTITAHDWITDGYGIHDVLLKILQDLFSFHSLLVFLGFSFNILSAFFLCCLPQKEACYLLRCQVIVYFKNWFATWESCLLHGFQHRYRIHLVTSLITSIINVKQEVCLYFG